MDRFFTAEIQARSEKYFRSRGVINALLMGSEMRTVSQVTLLDQCRRDSLLTSFIPWCFDSDQSAFGHLKQAVAKSGQLSALKGEERHLAAMAFMEDDYAMAEKYLAAYHFEKPSWFRWSTVSMRIYLLLLAQKEKEAVMLGQSYVNANLRHKRVIEAHINKLHEMASQR